MKSSRAVVSGALSPVLIAAVSWAAVGCSDASPLMTTGPRAALNVATVTASTTAFDGFINFCHNAGLIDFRATPGGTVHFLVANENRWVTGNQLIDGLEHNTGNAKINRFGQVVVNLQNSLKPDAVNGTWEIIQQLRIGDGTTSGVGHGTGDLQGMTLTFTTDPEFVPTSVCNPDELKAGVHGTILKPAS